jgi:hypothetical protein
LHPTSLLPTKSSLIIHRLQSASFPSPVFNTAPDSILRASSQFSFELADDSRENLDIELTTMEYANYFEAILESLIPNLAKKPSAAGR